MRKSVLYPKLAFQNISRNRQFYFPFILTCIAACAMFYIMCFLTFNEGTGKMQGAEYLSFILSLGCIVIGLFSVIFLFYTNSFLIKRRQKELGLYNILGMGKGNIAAILSLETLYVTVVTLVLGLGLGILLSKLTLLALCRLIGFAVPYGFEVSLPGIRYSVCLFSGISLAILISNLVRIRLANPVELLRGGNVGEKEPKTRWVLAVLGLLSLGAGYWIAVVTEAPLQALLLFFVAVVLVIAGTYLLFTASSIALLKRLKGHLSYYYTTRHFIPVSGMIYRMKQNAVGLANICILATMVLVMVSGTVCLYLGAEDVISAVNPTDLGLIVSAPEGAARERLRAAAEQAVTDSGLELSGATDLMYIAFSGRLEGKRFTEPHFDIGSDDNAEFFLTAASEYAGLGLAPVSPDPGEAVLCSRNGKGPTQLTLFGVDLTVVQSTRDFPAVIPIKATMATHRFFLVVSDADFEALTAAAGVKPHWYLGLDLSGTAAEKAAAVEAVRGAVYDISLPDSGEGAGHYQSASVDSRADNADFFYGMYGGFLFLGLFLGLVFLMATVLIIYYKQLSEGYDDKARFEIMQKVGLSRPEIRRAIRSQVLLVFFLPLGMAVIHIAFAFKMITKLLLIFNLTNIALFAACTLGTIAVFALIYGVVYLLTARVYYRIVS